MLGTYNKILLSILFLSLFTVSPAHAQLEFRVGATTIASGGVLDFGSLPVDTPITREVTFVNVGNETIDLASMVVFFNSQEPGQFTVPGPDLSDMAPGEARVFEATFLCSEPATITNHVLFTTAANGPSYRIYLRATAVSQDAPRLLVQHAGTSIRPDEVVHLGSTTLGEDILSSFNLRNLGPTPLTVHGVTWSGQEVSFATSTPSTVPANDIRSFTLRFGASTPGSHSTNITVSTDDPSDPLYRFTMTWTVTDSRDFDLQAGPPSREVHPGGRAFYTVSAEAINGFDEPVTLSASGMPEGVLVTFTPQTVQPGEVSEVRVNTALYTPAGTHPLTFTGTGGGLARTATVDLVVGTGQASGQPEIDSLSPAVLTNANGQVVTVTGRNLQGSTVSIPRESPDPDNPVNRSFPSVTLDSISTDGTTMRLRIHAANPEIFDFYNLLIDNGQGQAAEHFRVVPEGPLVDAWTPAEPARGQIYVLSLVGHNLRHATVSPSHNGRLRIFSLDNARQDRLNAVVEVLPDAPTGPIQLVVRGPGGQSVSLPITIRDSVTSSPLLSRDVIAYQSRDEAPRRFNPEGPEPKLYLQDFVMRETEATTITDSDAVVLHPAMAPNSPRTRSAAASSANEGDSILGGTIYCYFTLPLVDFHWQIALVFDPETGKIGDASLQGLNLGDRATIGAFVVSFYLQVDLTVYFRCDFEGWSFPLFCLRITSGTEIPGHSGFAYSIDFCFGGVTDSGATGNTTSLEVMGGPCARVEDQTQPNDGIVFATLEQTDCCPQPIDIVASGHTFSDYFFGEAFNLSNSNVASTTPDPSCGSGPLCEIELIAPPACVAKDKARTVSATGKPAGGSFSWRVAQGAGRASLVGATDQNVAIVKGNNASDSADDVRVEATYRTSEGITCSKTADLSVVEVVALQWKNHDRLDRDFTVPGGIDVTKGLPMLGPVTLGQPAGATGWHKNMEIKATIKPCDSNLRCKFDFKRERQGTVGLLVPNGNAPSTLHLSPIDCPAGGCNDDHTNLDEDLAVDSPPGCGVFVLDTPGFTTPPCSQLVDGMTMVSCLSFEEWLEVDGVRVPPTQKWHASSRALCQSPHWSSDPQGQGNRMGTGVLDCSRAAAVPGAIVNSPVVSEPQPEPDPQRLTTLLQSSNPLDRLNTAVRIREIQRSGGWSGDDRDILITALVQIAAETGYEVEEFSATLLAVQLLGELKASEGIPVLIARVEEMFEGAEFKSFEDVSPAALALAQIGPAIIEPILDRTRPAPRTEWTQLVHALRRLPDPADLEEALHLRWRTASARELKRFEALLSP